MLEVNVLVVKSETNAVCFVIFFRLVGRGGSAGGKFRISLGLPVGAVINCADNTGEYFEICVHGCIVLVNLNGTVLCSFGKR